MALVRDPALVGEPDNVKTDDMKAQAWTTRIPTGAFGLVVGDGKVIAAGFTDSVEALLEQVPHIDGAEMVSEIPGVTDRVEAYFDGELGALDDIPVAPTGSDRKLGAWETMRRTPPGPMSYKQLAQLMPPPASARSAARACATNPIALIVPCHRFVGSDGKMHGFGWGVPIKEWLLAHEQRFMQ